MTTTSSSGGWRQHWKLRDLWHVPCYKAPLTSGIPQPYRIKVDFFFYGCPIKKSSGRYDYTSVIEKMRVYHIQPFIDWGKAHVIMFVRDIPISNGKVPMSLEITGFGLHASASSEASGGVLTDFCWTVKCSGLEKCTFCGFWVKGCCAICSHSFTILVLMDPQILVICGIKHAFLGYNHIAFWPIAIQWIVDSCRFF